MKKILIALPNDTLGGAEQYLKILANLYLNSGYSVFVLFLKKEDNYGWSEFKNRENACLIYTNASSEKFGLFSFIKNLWFLKRIKFDYIYTSHVHLTGLIGFFIKLKIIDKKFFIGRESTLIFDRFKGLKLFLFKINYHLGYSELDLLICQTMLMKQQFLNNLPGLSKKINVTVIPNLIDLNNNNVTENSFENISFQNFIVSAGRLIPEKGFDLLIDAFSRLHQDCPDLKLVILGEGNDRKFLEEKILNLKLSEFVFLHGFVKNVYPYFSAAKLCVVSSRIEGFPNVLLQMMSQNNNVISTKCAGGIDDIKGLFVSETNSVESLYFAIKNCLLSSETKKNRELFDIELESRSIHSFIDKINFELEKY
jgi:glycosyltransferase involved in cell wall biosynthesis